MAELPPHRRLELRSRSNACNLLPLHDAYLRTGWFLPTNGGDRSRLPPLSGQANGRSGQWRQMVEMSERLLKVDRRIGLADEADAVRFRPNRAIAAGDDHRHLGEAPSCLLGQILAADAWQTEVGQEEVEPAVLAQEFQRLLAATDAGHQA